VKPFRIILFLFVTSTLSGCINKSSAESPVPEIEFQELAGGQYVDNQRTFPEKQFKLITSQASYNESLLIYSNDDPASIDFINGQVLLVDMGLKGSGGYSIKIKSIIKDNATLTALVESESPAEGCPADAVQTNPYQFVYIPSKEEVFINESRTVIQCD